MQGTWLSGVRVCENGGFGLACSATRFFKRMQWECIYSGGCKIENEAALNQPGTCLRVGLAR